MHDFQGLQNLTDQVKSDACFVVNRESQVFWSFGKLVHTFSTVFHHHLCDVLREAEAQNARDASDPLKQVSHARDNLLKANLDLLPVL
jgi:hypothetical protein